MLRITIVILKPMELKKVQAQSQSQTHTHPALIGTGLLRIYDIVGCKKRNIQPLIPVCKNTFLNGCNNGKYPKPHKIGVWKVEEIKKFIETIGEVNDA